MAAARSRPSASSTNASSLAACENFGADRFLRAFSLVGTRGDTDLLLWSSAPGLADIHEFHVVLGQSGLMGGPRPPTRTWR